MNLESGEILIQGTDAVIDVFKNQYVSIRIKNQSYCGKPAIALYLRDRTPKMTEKLYRMKVHEKEQSQ